LFDIIGSFCLIVLLSPVFLLAIIGILLESGRPVFFLQQRAAIKGGKEFYFVKFRSMISNADELKEEMDAHNEADGALFKIKNDPRVTRVGRIIRKFSIDELPQLFNVLKGDMSLVGPRPLPLSDFCKANQPDEFWDTIKDRASVKPGMTGLWQVSGRSDVKFKDMILLDLYYVENHSIMFDLEILFETIPAVLFGRGAY
jgi:lipopolysaccharide/colanic/teichoic acid biosynthesis glycosyltransferase